MAVAVYPLKPTWASSTFLQYLGTIFALGSLGSLFTILEDAHGSGGLFGWSALALAIVLVLAVAAETRGEPIVAGLLAVVAVFCWAVLAGSLLDAIGFDLLPNPEAARFFNAGLALDTILLEALVIAGAAFALGRFRFPLLVLPLAAVVWYAVMDLLEGVLGGGDSATAILALLVGFVFVAVAAGYDGGGHHPYALLSRPVELRRPRRARPRRDGDVLHREVVLARVARAVLPGRAGRGGQVGTAARVPRARSCLRRPRHPR